MCSGARATKPHTAHLVVSHRPQPAGSIRVHADLVRVPQLRCERVGEVGPEALGANAHTFTHRALRVIAGMGQGRCPSDVTNSTSQPHGKAYPARRTSHRRMNIMLVSTLDTPPSMLTPGMPARPRARVLALLCPTRPHTHANRAHTELHAYTHPTLESAQEHIWKYTRSQQV